MLRIGSRFARVELPAPTGAPPGSGWTIEDSFAAGKELVGLDDHQVRGWTSWHRRTILAFNRRSAGAVPLEPPQGSAIRHPEEERPGRVEQAHPANALAPHPARAWKPLL